MRKALTIPLILALLFSGIAVKYSIHLCGGEIVSAKFSLRGNVATCNMELADISIPGLDLIKTHCCDSIATFFQLKTNYVPSSTYELEPVVNSVGFSFTEYLFSETPILITGQSYDKKGPPGWSFQSTLTPVFIHNLRI
jgi:hypothetical protein